MNYLIFPLLYLALLLFIILWSYLRERPSQAAEKKPLPNKGEEPNKLNKNQLNNNVFLWCGRSGELLEESFKE